MEKTRIVVTGLGALSPVGNDVPTLWKNIAAGNSGIDLITHFDYSDFDNHMAEEVEKLRLLNIIFLSFLH